MSGIEHNQAYQLLNNHASIQRSVEEISGGVKTTTVTSQPELVEILRAHVRGMTERLKAGSPVRMWDPVFRDVFAHAQEIQVQTQNIDGGIAVTETSSNPEVVEIIRAHAKQVSRFVADGHSAAAPPWAGVRR